MSGPLSLVGTTAGTGGDGTGALPRLPGPRRAPSWAAADPVAELAERLSQACASAVHPDEIAAVLESEGLTDEQITGLYGHPDLFSLARELFTTVPRDFPEPAPWDDPWQVDVWRCVLRGLTFALPGVAYVLGGRWADGPDGPLGVPRAVAAWGAAALCGWGWNQALAHRAHLHLLLNRPRAAARCLVTGAAAGAALATLAAAAVAGPGQLPALAFAAGQSLYVAAATLLLVLGRERSLLYVLTPLAVAVGCGAAGLPTAAVAAVLIATVAGAVAAALGTALRTAAAGAVPAPVPVAVAVSASVRTGGGRLRAALSRRRTGGDAKDGDRKSGSDDGTRTGPLARPRAAVGALRTADDGETGTGTPSPYLSLAHGLSGLAGGALVVSAALTGEFVASLTVSMGVAEWLLFRFRSRCLRALRRTSVHERLLARSWRVLAGCLAWYALALAGLAAVEAVAVPGAAAWNPARLAVLLALGCTLWLSLLLQSCGRAWAGSCVLGAAAVTALSLLGAHVAATGAVLGLVCTGAAAVLLATALAMTGRVTTHR